MPRLIKFRVYSKKQKTMFSPDCSLFFYEDDSGNPKLIHHLDGEFNKNFQNENTEDCVIQQFTGLTDINNKEIYEGDIILFNDDERLLIEWNSESAAFVGIIYLEHDGDQWREPDFDAARSLDEFCGDEEVIGNVFENPTLLQP